MMIILNLKFRQKGLISIKFGKKISFNKQIFIQMIFRLLDIIMGLKQEETQLLNKLPQSLMSIIFL